MLSTALTYASLTFAIALVCGLLPVFSKIKQDANRLKMITGIAAGIIIGSAMLVVIPEGYALASTDEHHEEEEGHDETQVEGESHDEENEHSSEILIGVALASGFVLMLILEGSGIGHAVHEEHHDHDDDHGHGHVHHGNGWMLVLGLTLHAATDGLAVGAAVATGSIALTAAVAFAVLIHKAPAAFSLGVFSMHERKERKESIRDVLIFSLATPIMIVVAYFALSDIETSIIGLAMLFSAGTFLYVATVDTLPDIHNAETGKKAMQYVVLGILIMLVLLLIANSLDFGHAH